VQRSLATLDPSGSIVQERDVDPSAILGGTIALGL